MEHRRLFLAILLSLAVVTLWQIVIGPPERPVPPPAAVGGAGGETVTGPAAPGDLPGTSPDASVETPAAAAEPGSSATPGLAEAAPQEPVSASIEETVVVEIDGIRAELTNRGAQLRSVRLAGHEAQEGGALDLVRTRRSGPYPYGLSRAGGAAHPLNEALFELEEDGREGDARILGFRYVGPEGAAYKRFRIEPGGRIDAEVTVSDDSGWGLFLGPGLRNPSPKEFEDRFGRRAAVYKQSGELERELVDKADETLVLPGTGLAWAGLEDNYFLSVLIFDVPGSIRGVSYQPVMITGDGTFSPLPTKDLLTKEQKDLPRDLVMIVEAGGESLKTRSYWGAKELRRLAQQPGGLDETINLGFFRVISAPMLRGLDWVHNSMVANYGWAIVLMTVFIKLLLLPLTHKSTVSMRRMQEVNPEIQAVRAKYKPKLRDKQGRPNVDAQRKMNEEVMGIYKQAGANPASGCFPMLLQLPVFFAFYYMLGAAVELRGAPWLGWIRDLSAPDPIYVLPVVMGGTQFLQQKLTPSTGDPMQRRIFQLMPIFMTVIFLGFPSGLVLYWLTNNVLTIAQQWVYNHLKKRDEQNAKDERSGKAPRSKGKPKGKK